MELIEIRDLRQKDKFILDDQFLNGYARFLEIYAVGVYVSLCRHANKEQNCWPSIKKIAEELAIGKNSIVNSIKRLEFWNIVRKERIGKTANNRYWLIDKKYWKPVNKASLKEYSEVCHINFTSLPHKLHSKETHSKETNKKEKKEKKEKELSEMTSNEIAKLCQ